MVPTTELADSDPLALLSGRTLRPGGRKVRTRDCRKCLIMGSLVEAGLPASTIEAFCQRMWLNRVRRHQILFAEGNRSTYLYAIRRGKVKLVKVDAGGREHLAAVLEAGDLFGFEAVFGDAYAAGAEALTDGEVCVACGDELKELMERVPRVAIDLARYLHHQLSRARERQSYVTAPGAQAKLAGYLLHELAASGQGDARDRETRDGETRDGETVVRQDLTLRDLGGILGLSPETVCRTLATFKARGISRRHPGGLLIRDLPALERLAGR